MIPTWFNSSDQDDTGTVFRDVIFIMMLMFMILFLAAIAHINTPGEKEEETAVPPGNVMVDIGWPDGINVDVDLWVKGPKDTRPVGYSNRAGIQFNLLRDDLGSIGDSTERNYENAYTRGIEDGEYIINLHLYNPRNAALPIPVSVVVKIVPCISCRTKEIYSTTVNLVRRGQEITVIRFTLDDKQIVQDKTNTIPISLRQFRPAHLDVP